MPHHWNRFERSMRLTAFAVLHSNALRTPLTRSRGKISKNPTKRLANSRKRPRVTPTCNASITREIVSLAIPALGALALDPLLSLIDTAFVGRLGVTSLAGTGIATILLNTSFSVFHFLSISTTPLVANAIQISQDETSRVTANGILLASVLGLASATSVILLAQPLCIALGASAASLQTAVTYLRLRAVAAPFALASLVTNGALRAHKDIQTSFRVALTANLLNIILDFVLIFPFRLGVAGAALATSVSQILAFSLMISSLVQRGRLYFVHLLRVPRLSELVPLLSAGALLSIRTISLLATIAYATSIAAARGVIELAAYELCRQLWIFKATVLNSLTTAAQALVASAMAARTFKRAREIADHTLRLATGFGFILGIFAIATGTALPGLFTSSEAVSHRAAECIRVAALCAPLNGAVFALDGILAACEDYRYLASAIALACLFGCIAISGVKACGGGAVGVWCGMNFLMIARAIVLFWRYLGSSSPLRVSEGK